MSEILTVDSFYEFALQGKLLGLQCDSAHISVPPRRSCRVCRSTNLNKIELSGSGKIVSWTEVFVKSKEFPVSTPYFLALVELEEGGNLMGIVDGPSSSLKFGTVVSVIFRRLNEKDWPRIFFSLKT